MCIIYLFRVLKGKAYRVAKGIAKGIDKGIDKGIWQLMALLVIPLSFYPPPLTYGLNSALRKWKN